MKKRKIVAIIQARLASTRLPKKILKNIEGKPMLGHVIERLKHSQLIDEIVIAIADEPDTPLPKLATKYGAKSFIGSQQDVLDRHYQTSKAFRADVIVRVTSDCPLIDPEIVDVVIAHFLKYRKNIDFASNALKRTFPHGLNVEVFSFEALQRTWRKSTQAYQREHVTPYIWEHPLIFRLTNVENRENLSHFRWTVDEKKDLEFVREIYKRLYRNNRIFLMKEILALLNREPNLTKINSSIQTKLPGAHIVEDSCSGPRIAKLDQKLVDGNGTKRISSANQNEN